jgi:nucleoside-diphosphate-sugar epimerase
MAENFRISAKCIHFCPYIVPKDPEELLRVNVTLLKNFLQVLVVSGADKKVKRFVLTCGLKQYGVHMGPGKQPFLEDDPLLENGVGGISWPPIFYYEQQMVLAEAAAKGK